MKWRALALAAAMLFPVAASQAAAPWQDRRASELIGAKAVDRNGKDLGRIEDLILASRTGVVHYAVVSFSRWLGLWLGERLHVFPVNALAPGRSAEVAIQVDKKDLGKRTGVDELERWLHPYYSDAAVADERFLPASKLLGKAVEDERGAPAGKVADLIVNLGSGLLRHVVVTLDGEALLARPGQALSLPLERNRSVVLELAGTALASRYGS